MLIIQLVSAAVVIALIIQSASASQESFIRFDVTVIAPQCIINDNKPISIDFGSDVKISHIGRGDYKLLPVPFTVQCAASGSHSLVVQGTGASFDSAVLSTNKSELGIEFIIDNKRAAINKAVPFNYPILPLISVRPVVSNSKPPLTGEFSATAIMRINYD